MRLCYAGPVWAHKPKGTAPERGIDGAHSCNAIGESLARVAAAYDIRIDQWNFWHEVEGRPVEDVYDGVIIYDHSMLPLWQRVVPKWSWKHKLNVFWTHVVRLDNHEAVASYCTFAREHADLIGFLDQAVLSDFQRMYGNREGLFVWPWGCRIRPFEAAEPNPYRTDKKVMLWCGRLGPRSTEYLQLVADRLKDTFELHVISITPEQEQTRCPGIYEGALKYGTFDHFISHADVGLDLAVNDGAQTAVNTKVYEYLGAGLPVAHEPILGSQVIRDVEHGYPARICDLDDYCDAVRKSAAISRNRRRLVSDIFQSRHTWDARARELLTRITGMANRRAEPIRLNPVSAWDIRYAAAKAPAAYGGQDSYLACLEFFRGCELVEDWGCGVGWFAKLVNDHGNPYVVRSIDGSHSRFCDEVADLRTYRGRGDGILLRHVLEHNHDWREVLRNALRAAVRRLAVVIYTPMVDETKVIATFGMDHGRIGCTYSFSMADLESEFGDWKPEIVKIHDPKTDFQDETLFLFRRD